MSTITAVLQPDVDGMLHLPVPEGLKAVKVRVMATLEAAEISEAGRRKPEVRPDFAAIRRRLWGRDVAKRRLSPEDSAFIRDRGAW